MHESRVLQTKEQLKGRWLDVLVALGKIDRSILDGRHHPCPKCGGRDRFRLIDVNTGALFCNQCFTHRNGDGFSALMWLRGWDFETAFAAVANWLKVPSPGQGKEEKIPFTPEDAGRTYDLAVWRAGEIYRAGVPHAAVTFLTSRGLEGVLAFEPFKAVAGILDVACASASVLPPSVRAWPGRGYQLVCPLWAIATGDAQAVQGRDVTGTRVPSKMSPKGSTLRGSVFANHKGRSLLRGESDAGVVFYGEGLTDSLALALSLEHDAPALCVPGVGSAPTCVGKWARKRLVIVTLDNDPESRKWIAPTTRAILDQGGRAVVLTWPKGVKDANDALVRYGVADLRARFAAFVAKAVNRGR